MGDHYYTKNPSVNSNPKVWQYELKGHRYTFTSDTGVFSKKEVDFGSKLLIDTFVLPSSSGDVLDVGCGYGPIGLTTAKENPEVHVDMVDINERAVNLATENAKLNGVSNVSIYSSDLFENVTKTGFAAILSNPPIRAGKKVVHHIFEESFNRLIIGGELWIVIQKKQGAPSAIEKLSEIYGEVEVVEKKKGYFIIKAVKTE
ncbi:class I SAM-dependent methyltransferase [Bacillus timonensis]|nr:class I SAM-dependent methyltransferase [Bacillus timonensis]